MLHWNASLADYVYELRRSGEIIATGHLTRDEPLEVDDEIMIAGRPSVVRAVEPQLGDQPLHLLLEDTTVD